MSSSPGSSRRPSELKAAAALGGLGGPKADAAPEGDGKVTTITSKFDKKKVVPFPVMGGKRNSSKLVDKSAGQITAQQIMDEHVASGKVSISKSTSGFPAMPPLPTDGPLKKKPKTSAETQSKAATADDMVNEDGEKTSFPLLLHNVISDPATDDCIHWLSCGTRFIISDKKKFSKDVLPRFYGPAKFTSFTRRLKRWSFQRVPSGPFMGAYYNPNFRRDEPDQAHRVRYNHPSPLTGEGLAMQQQKLAAVKSGNPNMMMPPMMNPMNMPGMTDEQREQMFKQMSQGMPMMGMMGYPMMGPNGPMMPGMGMPPGYPGPGGKDGEEKDESVNDKKESGGGSPDKASAGGPAGGPPGMGNFSGYGMMPGMMPYGFNPMMMYGGNNGPSGNQGDDKEAGKQEKKV